MNENSNQNYSPFLPFLAIVIAIALAYLAIGPWVNDIRQLDIDNSVKKQQYSALEEKIGNLEYLQGQFKQNPDKAKLINIVFPSGKEMEDFIVQVSNMAKTASLNIDAIKPLKKTTQSNANLEVDISGNYENLVMFLGELENNDRLVSVKSINITTLNKDGQNQGYVSAQINLSLIDIALTDKDTTTTSTNK